MNATQLLTTRQVAEKRGVIERTVRKWCKLGHLPAVMLGRDWFIDPLDLKAFKPPANGRPVAKPSEKTRRKKTSKNPR